MALSKKTITRLRWLKRQLAKYPHRYNQAVWCGTKACLAGFVLPKALSVPRITLQYAKADPLIRECVGEEAYLFVGSKDYSEVARRWLGITHEEADHLFIY